MNFILEKMKGLTYFERVGCSIQFLLDLYGLSSLYKMFFNGIRWALERGISIEF